MRKIKSIFAVLALVNLIALATAPSVRADVNDFTVTSFKADYTLDKADPHGQLHVVEAIDVNFTDQNHGILRAIPDSYNGHSLEVHINKISSSSATPAPYTTYESNGNTVLKIGDPGRTVTGRQAYVIDYTLNNVITFYKDHDELYWNVNGDQWSQPFQAVSATLHLPSGVKLSSDKPVCYTGSNGSTNRNCLVTRTGDTLDIVNTLPLSAAQTMSFVVGFQKGYFAPYTWQDWLKDHMVQLTEAVLLPLVVLVGSYLYWRKNGRDAPGRGTIVPEYGPPEGLKPLEVGTIIDFKVDNRDITATIIDLAVRRYIKIIETKHDRLLLKDTQTYTLELTNPDLSALNTNERLILNAIFTDKSAGALADLSSLKYKFYSTAKLVRTDVEVALTTLGYFKKNPLKSGKKMTTIGMIVIIGCFYLGAVLGPALAIGVVVSAAIIMLFGRAMPSRTAKGVAAKGQIEGLKLYLQVAEAERLKMLQSPKAPYAGNAGEPVKTADLFEKLLPYAMVLGVEKEWAKQFESIYTTAPDWYAGNWTTFNAVYLASSLNAGVLNEVNTAFSTPRSSGSNGFGGGGFAGGGGGGGGGGGW
jgi:uncharacterized membrane protein